MKKCGKIRIELRSDLCLSSGYSYARLIDADICYDDLGLPYIPARRLKGCMREAAETFLYQLISEEEIEDLFGKSGANNIQGIILEDARLENYECLKSEIQSLSEEFSKYVTKQTILGCYTHIAAQTKLVDGVAEDNTFRYTRVVNEHSPLDGNSLVFYAGVQFRDTQEGTEEKKLRKIVKATRSIGLKRNRGLGNVSCELTEVEIIKPIGKNESLSEQPEDAYVISYVLKNEEPLVLSNQEDSHSEQYISGQAVLGALAGAYLDLPDKSAEDEKFFDLFLNGTVKYTNVVPHWQGRDYYPAPLYINKLKKTKKLVNTIFGSDTLEAEYDTASGNQPKKLKGSFLFMDEKGQSDVHDVSMSVIYHNSHRGESRNGRSGRLYSLEAVSAGQEFAGKIYLPKKYVPLVETLLRGGSLRFGKSRSAQYGSCGLLDLKKEKDEPQKLEGKTGETVVVSLMSDGVFVNDRDYTVSFPEVYDRIASRLGLKGIVLPVDFGTKKAGMVQTGIVYGYQTKWNLQKTPVPVVKAGSAFFYTLTEDQTVTGAFVGEKNQEGFGQIRIQKAGDLSYQVKSLEKAASSPDKDVEINEIKPLIKTILMEKMLEIIKLSALDKEKANISAATLGRVTLMLRESLEEEKGDWEKAFGLFAKRVDSIKREAVKTEIIKNVLGLVAEKNGENWKLKKQLGLPEERLMEPLRLMQQLGYSREKIDSFVAELWGDYLMTMLVDQKYRKREEVGK